MSIAAILVGLPGSGKSTHVNGLLEFGQYVVCSSDNWIEAKARELGTTYDAVFSDYIKEADAACWKDFVTAVKDGKNIIIDRTNLTKKSRKRWIKILQEYDYEIHCYYFPRPDDLERRLASRPGKTIPKEVIERMESTLVEPTLDEGFRYLTIFERNRHQYFRLNNDSEAAKDGRIYRLDGHRYCPYEQSYMVVTQLQPTIATISLHLNIPMIPVSKQEWAKLCL